MFDNIGVWDWGIILLIILVLFGGKRLPELARSLGRSIAEFKKGLRDGENEIKRAIEDKTDPGQQQQPPKA